MTPAVHIHLEEVILHGVSPAHRDRAADALRGELVRLLTEHGLPAVLLRAAEVPHIAAGSIELTPGLSPETYGVRVARSFYRGLAGEVPR
jgi:hypothetical protein